MGPVNTSRLGEHLHLFLVSHPEIYDAPTAYNIWARDCTEDYGMATEIKAVHAMRYLNALLGHSHQELCEMLPMNQEASHQIQSR